MPLDWRLALADAAVLGLIGLAAPSLHPVEMPALSLKGPGTRAVPQAGR